jgi:hypothetical protein
MHVYDLVNTTDTTENPLVELEHQFLNINIKDINPTIQYIFFVSLFLMAVACFLPCILSTIIRTTICMFLKIIYRSLTCLCLTCLCRKKNIKNIKNIKDIKYYKTQAEVQDNEKIDDKKEQLISS